MMRKVMKKQKYKQPGGADAGGHEGGHQAGCLHDEHGRHGHKAEELIDGVELGGVGAYLGDAEEADVNLFI
jgi:hypothetical protein